MKKQIIRFSPHQNAKVFAILMAIGSLPIIFPMVLMSFVIAPVQDVQGSPVKFPYLMSFMFPVIYLVLGYLSIAIGCWVYNFMYRFIGGFEYEANEK